MVAESDNEYCSLYRPFSTNLLGLPGTFCLQSWTQGSRDAQILQRQSWIMPQPNDGEGNVANLKWL